MALPFREVEFILGIRIYLEIDCSIIIINRMGKKLSQLT